MAKFISKDGLSLLAAMESSGVTDDSIFSSRPAILASGNFLRTPRRSGGNVLAPFRPRN
ncbi:MAG TPA: hypothetical protein VN982_16145 [Candidatus Dormibacteraeota bacterium]|nr:hypothetical protein [Candidatus Dormibacteraeota bacterium]